MLLALASCGGGGGGSSGFQVHLDRQAAEFIFEENTPPRELIVSATWSGSPPGQIYIGAVVEGEAIHPTVSVVLTSATAFIRLIPRSTLPAGRYTGRVLAMVCADQACLQPIGGSPIPLAYTVTVLPGLGLSPNPMALASVSGVAVERPLAVTLPPGETAYQVRMAEGSPALSLKSPENGGPSVIGLPWKAGTYTAMLEVTSGSRKVDLPVRYVVTVPAGGEHPMALAPTALSLSTSENASSAAQALVLTPATWQRTDPVVSVGYGAGGTGWLTLTRTANGYAAVASAQALARGTYTATVSFVPDAPSRTVTVPVSLTVGPGLVAPAGPTLTVGAETESGGLSGSVPIEVAAGPVLAWTASSDQDWLRLTRSSGTTGSALEYAIDLAGLQAVPNHVEQRATVQISSALPHVLPVSFQVTLRKQLPEVSGLGPYLVLTGRESRVIVRGRGFDAVRDVAARLQTAGLPVIAVNRVSDTQLIVQVHPTTAVDRRISFGNALGLEAPGTTLRVIAPQAYGYAAVPSGSAKRSMVFDARRRAVYAVDAPTVSPFHAGPGNQALTRFRHDGAAWSVDNAPVPSILDAGLGPDGESIVVTSSPARLQLLDPLTLQARFTLDHKNGFMGRPAAATLGISSTNDGRSWLAFNGRPDEEFVYFDHASRTIGFRTPQANLKAHFFEGPWTSVSRDGERMWVSPTKSQSTLTRLLYADATDALLKENNVGATYVYDAQLSDDGARMLTERRDVRDRDFKLIGMALIPARTIPYKAIAAAMAPDGSRAYLLAYREDTLRGGSAVPPRVFVFDATAGVPGSDTLMLVGEFDLAHYPTCHSSAIDCDTSARSAISPDGLTLFFLGDAHLVVAPVPAEMLAPASVQGPGGRAAMRAWTPGTSAR